MTRWLLVAIAVILALVTTACGGDDADDGDQDAVVTEDPTPTPAEEPSVSDGDDAADGDGGTDATPTPAVGGEGGGAGSAGGADGTDGAGEDEGDAEAEPTPTPTPPPCAETGERVTGGTFPAPGTGDRLLTDARLGVAPGIDRFVLEFGGDTGLPPDSYLAQWSSVPVASEGSGEPILVEGGWYLELRVAGASLFDFESGVPYDGPTELSGATENIRGAASGGSFEGYMVWAVGADEPTGFRVLELADPARLVVEICTGGPTYEDEAFTGEVVCPTEPVPDGAVFSDTIGGDDLDGDGTPDVVSAFNDPATGRWVLSVEPGSGGRINLPADHGSAIAPGRVLGSVDVDVDGVREIFGIFDVGARAEIISVAHFSGCSLRWVRFESGDPASFVVTAGLFDAAAVSCAIPEGWILQDVAINLATDPDTGEPISWTLESTVYELDGDVLVDLSAGEPPNPDPPFIESPTPPLEPTLICGELTY